jgi:hypothetical protein
VRTAADPLLTLFIHQWLGSGAARG